MKRALRLLVAALALWASCVPVPSLAHDPDPAEASKEADKARALAGKLAAETPPGTGFEGRVVREGEVVAGERIYVYNTFGDAMGGGSASCRPNRTAE